jgi:hypothetical protein
MISVVKNEHFSMPPATVSQELEFSFPLELFQLDIPIMKNIGINVQPGQVRIFLQSQGSML